MSEPVEALYPPGVAFLSGGLGDQLTQLPHLAAIARQSQGGDVALASIRAGKVDSLFAHLPYIGPVIDMWHGRHLLRPATYRAVGRIAGLQRQAGWFLHRSTTMLALGAAAGLKRRIGFHRGEWLRRQLLTDAVDLTGHKIEQSWGVGVTPGPAKVMLEQLGFSFDYDSFIFAPDPSATLETIGRFADLPRPFFVLGIGASWPEKRWPAAYFRQVMTALGERQPMTFILFAGLDSIDTAQFLRDKCPPGCSLIDLTTAELGLPAEHALIASALGYLGNDSFGLNLAAFCALPAIGLFGTTPPLLYRRNIHAVTSPEGQPRSMASITPEAALDMVYRQIPLLAER